MLTGTIHPNETRSGHQGRKLCYFLLTTEEHLLKRLWEVEDYSCIEAAYSTVEQAVIEKFEQEHRRDNLGRFIVPLSMKEGFSSLGESRSIAGRCFKPLEWSLTSESQSEDFAKALNKYFEMEHVEPVPYSELSKPWDQVCYLLMHAGRKEGGVKFNEQNLCCCGRLGQNCIRHIT